MTTLPGVGFAKPFGRGATLWLFELLAAWTGSGAVTTPSEALGGSGGGTICAKDVAPPDRDTKTAVPASNFLRMSAPFFLLNVQPNALILAGRSQSADTPASPCEQAFRFRGNALRTLRTGRSRRDHQNNRWGPNIPRNIDVEWGYIFPEEGNIV
jgi:hypothetical protein